MKRAKAMGKRRMIFGNISTSKKFNSLKTDQARLLYLMMYPHSDDFGRMEAEPVAIKMIAVPGLDWSFSSIQEYINDLSTTKLIDFYENDGIKYLEFVAFDDHQVFQRQRVGKYPEPLQHLECSKNDLNSLKIREVKESKVKESSLHSKSNTNAIQLHKPLSPFGLRLQKAFSVCQYFPIPKDQDLVKIQDGWEKLYAKKDIEREILKADNWIPANKPRSKLIFISSWLEKSEDGKPKYEMAEM